MLCRAGSGGNTDRRSNEFRYSAVDPSVLVPSPNAILDSVRGGAEQVPERHSDADRFLCAPLRIPLLKFVQSIIYPYPVDRTVLLGYVANSQYRWRRQKTEMV